MPDVTYDVLSSCDFFRGLSEKSMRALARVCVTEEFDRRNHLFFEGEAGRALHVLASGSVQLAKMSADGRETVIKSVKPGEVFAEVVLFERKDYPVSALATTRSQVYSLPKKDILAMLDDEPFRNDFISLLMRRMRYLADRILYLTAYDIEARFFLWLRERYGEADEYKIEIPKKDIASAIGTVPETLSRLLLRLGEEGKLSWQGRTVSLKTSFWDDYV